MHGLIAAFINMQPVAVADRSRCLKRHDLQICPKKMAHHQSAKEQAVMAERQTTRKAKVPIQGQIFTGPQARIACDFAQAVSLKVATRCPLTEAHLY